MGCGLSNSLKLLQEITLLSTILEQRRRQLTTLEEISYSKVDFRNIGPKCAQDGPQQGLRRCLFSAQLLAKRWITPVEIPTGR